MSGATDTHVAIVIDDVRDAEASAARRNTFQIYLSGSVTMGVSFALVFFGLFVFFLVSRLPEAPADQRTQLFLVIAREFLPIALIYITAVIAAVYLQYLHFRLRGAVFLLVGAYFLLEGTYNSAFRFGLATTMGMPDWQALILPLGLAASVLIGIALVWVGVRELTAAPLDKASARPNLPRPKRFWSAFTAALDTPEYAVHGPKKPLIPLTLIFLERASNALVGYALVVILFNLFVLGTQLGWNAVIAGDAGWRGMWETPPGWMAMWIGMFTAAAVAVFVLFAPLAILGRRLLARAFRDLDLDREDPPVLFLRSFSTDAQPLFRPGVRFLTYVSAPRTVDRLVLETQSAYGPVVAIGDPNDPLPPFGAARRYVQGENWRDVVSSLGDASRRIVLLVGGGEGVRWEVDRAFDPGWRRKTLFLLPREPAEGAPDWRDLARRFGADEEAIANAERGLRGRIVLGMAGMADGALRLFAARRAHAASYEVILRRAALLKEGYPEGVLARPAPNPVRAPRWRRASAALGGLLVITAVVATAIWMTAEEHAQGEGLLAARGDALMAGAPEPSASAAPLEIALSAEDLSATPNPAFLRAEVERLGADTVEAAAMAGDAEAQLLMGVIAEDPLTAAAWFRLAANGGQARAMFEVGMAYRNHVVGTGDEHAELAWQTRGAHAGNALAQYRLSALLLADGEPNSAFPPNLFENEIAARAWALAAAQQGLPDAQNHLGVLWIMGRGGPADPAQAAQWFYESSQRGHRVGLYNLGIVLMQGNGVPRDSAAAARLFQLAAERGNPDGATALGDLLANGDPALRDVEEAARWFEFALDMPAITPAQAQRARAGLAALAGGEHSKQIDALALFD